MKRILFVAMLLILVLSACGPQATPTIDPAQVQASAMAAANTMVAMTQAAIPTATPIPPTPIPTLTPLPSPTPIPLPTLAFQPSPTPNTSSSTGDCNHVLDVGSDNPAKAKVKINNNTQGSITITIGKSQKDKFGQCGYISFVIPKKQSVSTSVPQSSAGDACYWFFAFVNDPKKPTQVSGGGCMNNPDKWTLDVGYDTIKVTPP